MATVQIKNGRRLGENDIKRLVAGYGPVDSVERGVGTWSVHFRNPQAAQQAAGLLDGYDIGVGRLKTTIVPDRAKVRPHILYQDVDPNEFQTFRVDSHNQAEVPAGHNRVTLCRPDGTNCDTIARYDRQTNTIHPPQFY